MTEHDPQSPATQPPPPIDKRLRRYSVHEIAETLRILEANSGNIARTARQTGLPPNTLRRWRRAALLAALPAGAAHAPLQPHSRRASARTGSASARRDAAPAESLDLLRFSRDSWEIIHRANEVVKGGVDELAPKDAASIAAGYFDRQAKAEERLSTKDASGEEYAAEWHENEK